jgi:hypothetical protein
MLTDNVGGYILGLMLKRLKRHGRVAAWYVTGHDPSMKLKEAYFISRSAVQFQITTMTLTL